MAADPADAARVRDLQETERQLGAFGSTVVDMFRKAQSRQAVALAELVGQQSSRAKSAGPSTATVVVTKPAPKPADAVVASQAAATAAADPLASGAGDGGAGMEMSQG